MNCRKFCERLDPARVYCEFGFLLRVDPQPTGTRDHTGANAFQQRLPVNMNVNVKGSSLPSVDLPSLTELAFFRSITDLLSTTLLTSRELFELRLFFKSSNISNEVLLLLLLFLMLFFYICICYTFLCFSSVILVSIFPHFICVCRTTLFSSKIYSKAGVTARSQPSHSRCSRVNMRWLMRSFGNCMLCLLN